jgi:hypothetical protein
MTLITAIVASPRAPGLTGVSAAVKVESGVTGGTGVGRSGMGL